MKQKLVQRCETEIVADACNASYSQEIVVWQTGSNTLAIGNLSIGTIFYHWGLKDILQFFLAQW